MKLRKIIIPVILSALSFFLISCGTSRKVAVEEMDYSIEGVHIGIDGTYLVKVTYKTSDLSDKSMALAGSYAVRGVLFKGFAARKGEFSAQYPLVREKHSLEIYQTFFDEFLSPEGDYVRFVNKLISDAPEITKARGYYEISMIVSVSKDDLRRYLEDQGIIRKLSEGF